MNETNRIIFKRKRTGRIRVFLGILFLLVVCVSFAYASPETETSPFNDNLKTPPTFAPAFTAEKENTETPCAGEICAAYAAEKTASAKDKPVAAEANPITNLNWSFGLEPKNTLATEKHGNAARSKGLGGMVRGTLNF